MFAFQLCYIGNQSAGFMQLQFHVAWDLTVWKQCLWCKHRWWQFNGRQRDGLLLQ